MTEVRRHAARGRTPRVRTGTVSGEDLVDVELRLLAADGGLLVLAREHLADQAEREELEPDHDEEYTERQQRPLADRMAERLDDGQIDKDREPDHAEDETESAEQVQRPVPVAPDERDGEEVQEPADVALDPVTRAPVLTGAMVDGQLGHAEAAVLRQYGDEPV